MMELNQDYSTGNRIVDEVGRINISGNIIPMVWFQAIRYPNGKPNVNAIIILADIVYWYRPMSHISHIREKIEDDPGHPMYIQTVWGVGYKFNEK